MTDELGTLDPDGPTLRFERTYHHPIAKVWAAISDPAHQAVWFPQQVLGERRAGARLRFVTSVDPDDGFDGEMIAHDPPRLIEMWWGPSRLRIELHDDGSSRARGTVAVRDVRSRVSVSLPWRSATSDRS